MAVAFLKLFAQGEITERSICVSSRDGQARQLPGAPTYEECYNVTGIIRNIAPVNARFHKRKNLSENELQFGHVTSKLLASCALGQKSLKYIGFKEHNIISLSGASNY